VDLALASLFGVEAPEIPMALQHIDDFKRVGFVGKKDNVAAIRKATDVGPQSGLARPSIPGSEARARSEKWEPVFGRNAL